MRKYLSLCRVLIKGGLSVSDGKSKKGFQIFLYAVLAISILPLVWVIYWMVSAMLPTYTMLDQAAAMLGSMMFIACLVIFLFSIFIIPSVFYFSSDNETLLALPLTPIQIISSKFTVCLLYEYIFSLGILLPTYAAYLNLNGFSLSIVCYGLLVVLLMPIYPLVLSAIFTMIMMRFVPFFKNRDRFNLISGFLLLIGALGFSFASNSIGQSLSQSDTLAMMMAGNNSMLDLFMKFFPMIPFFSRAVVLGGLVDFLLGCGIVLISLAFFLTFGKFLYFKGAIGNGETTSSHKVMDEQELHKSSKQKSKILAYAIKDLKLLIRTPVYVMNCLSMVVLMPFLLLIFPLITNETQTINFTALIPLFQQVENASAYVILCGLGMGMMLGIMNLISATAISREGSNYYIMKFLPMPYADQIHAKSFCGILMGGLTLIFTLIPLMFLLPLSPLYYLLFFISACVTVVLGNELCIIVDLAKPKLVWEQEATAVKQNFGAFVAMMAGMALCVLFIGVCFIIPTDIIMVVAIGTLLLAGLGAYLSYRMAGSFAEKAMMKL